MMRVVAKIELRISRAPRPQLLVPQIQHAITGPEPECGSTWSAGDLLSPKARAFRFVTRAIPQDRTCVSGLLWAGALSHGRDEARPLTDEELSRIRNPAGRAQFTRITHPGGENLTHGPTASYR
jgi:hypothetical protein